MSWNRHFAAKLAALAASIVFGLVVSANAETWRIASKMPPTSPEGKGFAKFGELVEKYTNGEIDVKVFPSEQLGKSEAALEQLQAGTITVYVEGPSYLAKWVPEMRYTSASFLFKDRPSWVKFMHTPTVQGWLKKVEDEAGIAIVGDITGFVRGPYRVLVSKKQVKDLADLQGLKLRMAPMQLAVELWTHLGCEVRVLGWTEVYESISRGIVDTVTSPIALVESMKFYEVAPHIIRTDEYPQTIAFMANAKAYRSLSPELKAAVDKAFFDAADYSNNVMQDAAAASLKAMQAKGVTYDEIDTSDIVAKAAEFYRMKEQKGEMPAGFMDLVASSK